MNIAKFLLALCVFVGVTACEGGKEAPKETPKTEENKTEASTEEGKAEETKTEGKTEETKAE